MRSRLPFYFFFLAAVIFLAVQGTATFSHVRQQFELTTPDFVPDYLNGIKLLIALVCLVIAARVLARERRAATMKAQPHPQSRAPTSVGNALRQTAVLSSRRPIAMPILIALLSIIPFSIRAFANPLGWRGFNSRDWVLIGLVEIPFIFLFIFSIVAGRSFGQKIDSERTDR